jgi:thymidine kinase
MCKLTFIFGTMTSGKTTALLQDAYNFRSHGMTAYLLTARGDTRSGVGMIKSRIGIEAEAATFSPGEDIFAKVKAAHEVEPVHTVFVDEAQFLSRDQAWQLSDIVDELNIPVSAYGLRSDFLGGLFEGSAALMALADILTENTGVCASGEKAMMVARIGADGCAIIDGPQVMVGGEETYLAVSRKAWKSKVRSAGVSVAKLRAV